jgi:hypothetical protein
MRGAYLCLCWPTPSPVELQQLKSCTPNKHPPPGLVGGFIVLQLLARGTPPANIRILDIRSPERNDMTEGLAKEVEFIQTDITSAAVVDAAFGKPWPKDWSALPVVVRSAPDAFDPPMVCTGTPPTIQLTALLVSLSFQRKSRVPRHVCIRYGSA